MEDMFEITQDAKARLDSLFENRKRIPMRVEILMGPCGGNRLNLSLDKPRPDDHYYEVDGYTFIVEPEVVEQAAPFRLAVGRVGFVVFSRLKCGARECGDCLQ